MFPLIPRENAKPHVSYRGEKFADDERLIIRPVDVARK